MRLRIVSLFVSCVALGAVWACSLNPQPLPPDGYDAAADAALTSSPDGAGGVDGNADDGAVPSGDDASIDSSTDASDAGDASDAPEDSRDDTSSDAGEDG